MRVRRSFRSTAPVLPLIAALVFLGSNPAGAKKKDKPPPPAVWAITIPDCSSGDFNLCGIEQTYYEDGGYEDGLGIGVTGGQDGGSPSTRFSFAIYRCEPGEECYAENPPPDETEAPLPLYLRNIALEEILPIDWDEFPCQFPGTDSKGTPCCGLDPPLCMECFLNGPHPHWADDPEEDYRRFTFRLTVFDYDYTETPLPYSGMGYLSIEVYNTDDPLMPPDADDHNIFGDNWQVPTTVEITQGSDPDSWTVDVTVNEPMLFREWYTSCARDPNPKGKCPTETQLPLDAESTNEEIAFQVTWSRIDAGD